MSINTTIQVGNLTKDVAFSTTGTPRAKFSIAVNRRWLNKQTNQWVESTSYFDVVAWGDLATNLQASKGMGKGARVVVVGRFDQNNWEDSQGNKRSSVEIVADEVSPSLRRAKVSVAKVARNTEPTVEEKESTTNEEQMEAANPEGVATVSNEEPF